MLGGHMRVAERYILYRAERAALRGRRDGRGAARADRVRVDRPRARRRRPRSSSASSRAPLRPRRRRAPARRAQRQGADGARQRVHALRRPHPAQLRLRGDARLGHRARRHRRARRRAPPRAAADARARRRDRADRPAAARVRPRRARRRARSHRRPRLRLPRHPDALRPLPDLRQDARRGAPDRGAAAVLDARGDGRLPGRDATTRGARARPLRRVQGAAVLLLDADAVQRRHAALAALVLLPLRGRRHARVDHGPRHRRERDVLEVGGRARRVVDRGARHRLAHRRDQRRVAGRGPVPQAPQRPARRRQPGRPAGRARAARTSRSGTTTSATSSSCGAAPATSAAARTT